MSPKTPEPPPTPAERRAWDERNVDKEIIADALADLEEQTGWPPGRIAAARAAIRRGDWAALDQIYAEAES